MTASPSGGAVVSRAAAAPPRKAQPRKKAQPKPRRTAPPELLPRPSGFASLTSAAPRSAAATIRTLGRKHGGDAAALALAALAALAAASGLGTAIVWRRFAGAAR
jgi:hypothetical protein